VKLQRSAADGKVFDRIDAAYDRYVRGGERKPIEIWKFSRQVPTAVVGALLRIQANAPFLLHWTRDGWQHSNDTQSTATGIGVEFVDIPLPQETGLVQFTFLWVEENRWEGKDYELRVTRAERASEREPMTRAQGIPV
jgi:glucoamylase